MLEKVVQLERYKSVQDHKYYCVYKIIDSEFESGEYTLIDQECVRERLLIHEYNQRSLNVCANLKIHYSVKLRGCSVDNALVLLDSDMSIISRGYPYLEFGRYYPCLKRHIARMCFAGTIRRNLRH